MPRLRRTIGPLVLTLVLGASMAARASAAPPDNDTFAGARTITSLPFADTLDTSEATTDQADTAAAAACGASTSAAQARRSVWYAIRPDHDEDVQFDSAGTAYRVGFAVVSGTPAGFTRVACGLIRASATLHAGTTYYVDAVDFDGTGDGQLHLSVREVPPPRISVTLDSSGTFDPHSGSATVGGTSTCANADIHEVFASAEQPAAAPRVSASGLTVVPCDGSPHRWTISLTSGAGRFAGGPLHVSLSASACGAVKCVNDFTEGNVLLRPAAAP
jgi:hypothetical protein